MKNCDGVTVWLDPAVLQLPELFFFSGMSVLDPLQRGKGKERKMGKRIMLRRATSIPRLVGDRLVVTEHSSGEPLETPRHLNSVVSRPQLYEQAVVLQVDRQAPGRLRPPQLFTPRDSLRLLQHVRFQGPLRMPQLFKFPLISQIGSNEASRGPRDTRVRLCEGKVLL